MVCEIHKKKVSHQILYKTKNIYLKRNMKKEEFDICV